jgi:hypothetical protein
VEATFFSMGKALDSWLSSTKLTVLDHHGSHIEAGLINPPVQFQIENELADIVN